jgi:hypothetical protein
MTAWRGIVGKAFLPAQFIDYVQQTVFHSWQPRFVVLHSTGAPTLTQYKAYAGHGVSDEQWLLNLQGYYRDQQGWSAGPHLFVTPEKILAFTPLNVPGVHSPSWNGVSWGMEMVGDYQSEPFDPGVKTNAINALAVLHAKLGLDPNQLRFHCEDPLTTHKECPGKNAGPKADIIAAIEASLANLGQGEHTVAPTS